MLNFKLKTTDNFPLLNKSLEIAIFRIVQEFINNSLKHSKANTINIELAVNTVTAIIILKDNGTGFDIGKAINNGGMGLRNIKSRIQPYGGEISILSTIGKGTQYKINIPLNSINLQ